MSWTQLSPKDAETFIKTVAHPDHKIMFMAEICDVFTLNLPFYDGYTLTRISNKNMLPFLVLDYLSNGTDHYYLDGSESAFHNLNAKGALTLDQSNVTDYLDLYISYVYERGNSLQFPRDVAPNPAVIDEETPGFRINTPLIYHGKTIEADIRIHPHGAITIKSPFDVTYLSEPQQTTPINYTHPHAAQIIEQSTALIEHTETGARLLNLQREKNIPVRVLPSPSYQGFITNEPIVYITMPAAEQNAKYVQALCLAGGLRDAEQILGEYYHPHPDESEELYLNINTGKNLDMALEMCKIVKELDDQGITEASHDLSLLGLRPLYEGFKAGKDENTLYNIYAQIMIDISLINIKE